MKILKAVVVCAYVSLGALVLMVALALVSCDKPDPVDRSHCEAYADLASVSHDLHSASGRLSEDGSAMVPLHNPTDADALADVECEFSYDATEPAKTETLDTLVCARSSVFLPLANPLDASPIHVVCGVRWD